MKSEKVKEIKECLQSCNDDKMACYDCKYYGKCENILTKNNILTLINELESENSKLKQHKRELEGGQRDLLKVIKEFDKETQQLKDRIAELQEDKEKWQRKAINYYQMAKSYGIECIIDNDIDELLKEYENDTI